MKQAFTPLLILLMGLPAFAEEKAVCKISAKFLGSSLREKVVRVDLRQNYRYYEGKTEFKFPNSDSSGSIEILTWGGSHGQVHQNTFVVGPFAVSGVGLKVSLISDGSSVRVTCEIK